MIRKYPTINNRVVKALRLALTVGRRETSREPLTPSGLGPSIKKATAAEITTETM